MEPRREENGDTAKVVPALVFIEGRREVVGDMAKAVSKIRRWRRWRWR
jgi:hypothetical protein